jgi:hypothetical protein
MARVFPDGWRELPAPDNHSGELETLRELAEGLPDDYTVYHGVHWTRVDRNNHAIYGEIDYAVVSPAGKLLLIEKKAGVLFETGEGLMKHYGGQQKSVPFQLARNVDALHNRLRRSCAPHPVFVDALLYCPHHRVRNPGSAGIDPARIVDASRHDQLIPIIKNILPASDDASPAVAQVHRFLSELIDLVPEVHAVVGEAGTLYTRLSGGLSEWARKLDFSPFRLRVTGTAGSGKTQLAMAVFRDALAAGRRPLYVCYNRPLSDHIASIAPSGGAVFNYHQLGAQIAQRQGQHIDFRQPTAFAQIEQALDAHSLAPADCYDELIIDEGQDFSPSWAANLLRFLKPEGRAWWLEDPMQNLYRRDSVSLPGWTTLCCDTNYRSPRSVVQMINALIPGCGPMVSGSPVQGHEVNILTYGDTAGLLQSTITAINRCIGDGFSKSHIALISCRGREASALTPYDGLGPYTLKRPTGVYDLAGDPIHTEGDIVIDSVHRFKGRASPCVVLTEIDFEQLDENAQRRLFVGATRVTMKLVLVVSERTAKILLNNQH